VCFDEPPWYQFPIRTHLKYHDVCNRCISGHVETQLSDGSTVIPCPAEGCERVLEYEDIQRYSKKRAFDKFAVHVVARC
jgi:hypothetical protein